jgi:UDP-glucose 4-epimerase
MSKILITGGAGYIGSHTVWQLLEKGYEPIVLDNLSSGHRWAIPKDVPFYQCDIADAEAVTKIFKVHNVSSLIHFAAFLQVEESVYNPIKYYNNNFFGSMSLFKSCLDSGVKEIIFSSTAATYGPQSSGPVSEEAHLNPMNPYGRSKLMTETLLNDLTVMFPDLKYTILRYFNVAGARLDTQLGQATKQSTNLIKVAAEVAVGKRNEMSVFGTDYPTVDGTCVRDYIHVEDLAAAHIKALEHQRTQRQKGGGEIYNLGYGHGLSVLQVLSAMRKVSGNEVSAKMAGRRAGDPAAVVANSDKAKKILGWTPQYMNIETICETAYLWEKKLLEMNNDNP